MDCKVIEALINEYDAISQACEMYIEQAGSYEAAGIGIEKKLAFLKGIRVATFAAAEAAGVEIEWYPVDGHLLNRLRIK